MYSPLALQQRPEVQALGAGGQGVRAGLLPELGVDQHVPGDQDGRTADGGARGPLPGVGVGVGVGAARATRPDCPAPRWPRSGGLACLVS